ncbi:YkgJ family cysteine cluster protein [Roseibacillus ishigakijimensis]|uniref:YkgJ family cysteine cluster protein n=1 Tax=Roseibacillus ishigakijimensis TaxID=454146 RepID=A0A934VIS6_9BACT|nr:YkgJ family cysteine cluster protein [Roseibacillus ishigakijimensis]MBK1835383.1 YkgJ family cysteine cluster protein [Roseibacillus ishigakijimensis]
MSKSTERGNPAFPWHNVENNPCTSCGACCAFFRVSFYGAECDDSPWGTVPSHLTEPLTHHRQVMKGSNEKSPRCVALQGTIGECVGCSIHAVRASVCRDFPPSWENGVHNPDCDRARAAHGLPPLENPVIVPLQPDDSPTTPRRPGRRRAPRRAA